MKKLVTLFLIAIVMLASTDLMAQKRTRKNPQTIGGSLGFNLPTGSLGDMVGLGLAIQGEFNHYFSSKLAGHASIGYTTHFSKDNSVLQNVSQTASIVPLKVGVTYQFARAGKLLFIGGGELGIHFGSISIENKNTGFDLSSSTNELGLGFIGGAIYPIDKKMAFKSTLKYSILSTFPSLGIDFGLMYRI